MVSEPPHHPSTAATIVTSTLEPSIAPSSGNVAMSKSAHAPAPGWDWEAMSEDEKERIEPNINKIHEILDRMIARQNGSNASSAVTLPASKLTPVASAASDHAHISVLPTTCSTVFPSPDTEGTPSATRDADLITSPARCSLDSPSHDAGTPMSTRTAATAPTSSTATTDVFPKVAAPVVSNAAHDVDTISLAAPTPTTCSTLGPDHTTGGVDAVAVSLIPRGASTIATTPWELLPIPPPQWFTVPKLAPPTTARCLTKCREDDANSSMPAFALGAPFLTSVPLGDVRSSPAQPTAAVSVCVDDKEAVTRRQLDITVNGAVDNLKQHTTASHQAVLVGAVTVIATNSTGPGNELKGVRALHLYDAHEVFGDVSAEGAYVLWPPPKEDNVTRCSVMLS